MAWQTCMNFHKASRLFRSRGDTLYYLQLTLALLTAIVTIMMTQFAYEIEDVVFSPSSPFGLMPITLHTVCNYVLLMLPITTALVASILSKRRYVEKWAVLRMAMTQIISHIYQFRTQVGEYSNMPVQLDRDTDEAEDDQDKGQNSSEGSTRQNFVDNFNYLLHYGLSNVGEDSIATKVPLDITDHHSVHVFKKQMAEFVDKVVLEGMAQRRNAHSQGSRGCFRFCCGRKRRVLVDDAAKVPVPPDDCISRMTIETYLTYRLQPLILIQKAKTPRLASLLSRLEVLVIMLNALATVFVAMDHKYFVNLIVIIVTVTGNLMQYLLIQQRLSSHNAAIRTLDSMNSLMASQSIVKRRTRKMKTLCVTTVESAVLETEQALTGLPTNMRAVEADDPKEKKE